MLRFFTWKSFERLLRFDRVCLEAVLVPMLCVGMRPGGSASRISGRAVLKPIQKAPMDNAQIQTEEIFGSAFRAMSRQSLDTRAILLMNYSA
jgi:hypothetical protein